MTPTLEALARRAVACPRWRWMPGMRWTAQLAGGQSLGDRAGLILTEWDAVDDGGRVFRFGHPAMLPDLADFATLGCLLALVRKAWWDPYLVVRWSGHDWRAVRTDGSVSCWTIARGATEAEALIAALEAAP